MKVLITGAGGFVGQILAKRLVESNTADALILADVNPPPNPTSSQSVQCTAADLTSLSACEDLIAQQPDAVYILHGIMSSGSEANLELGLRVNFWTPFGPSDQESKWSSLLLAQFLGGRPLRMWQQRRTSCLCLNLVTAPRSS